MAILDIRKKQEEEITGIKFDDSNDVIKWTSNYIEIGMTPYSLKQLCDWQDFDNFIAALYKAKELAGK